VSEGQSACFGIHTKTLAMLALAHASGSLLFVLPVFLEELPISLNGLCISARKIHKSPEEIHISERKIPISFPEIHKSLKESCNENGGLGAVLNT